MSLGLIRSNVLKKTLLFLERIVLNKASIVSTISEPMKQRLEAKTGKNNSVVITPNWADPEIASAGLDGNTFRRDNGLPDDKYIVMYSGNLGEKQGVDILLEVSALLRGNPDIHLVVIGDGVAKEALVSKVEKMQTGNIMFLPVQARDKLPAMLHAADVHLVIQKHEVFTGVLPSKLTNIFASGRPSVITASAGTDLEALVTSKHMGLAVEPENAVALADAVCRLAANKELASEMGKNAREYAVTKLDMEHILTNLEDGLGSLLVKSDRK
jgi:colanic acid biosynthesis glycosyl transferase WcaI